MKFVFLIMLLVSFAFNAFAETVQLNADNTVYFKDVVYSESVTSVIGELAKRESNSEPVIYLVLDTPGGSVFAGLNLIHFLKGYKKPVKTITVFAASMGFQIANGNPGERLIVDTGVLMSHPMSGGMGGEIGEDLSLDRRIGYIKEVVKTMDDQVVARTKGKQTLATYRKGYDNELWTTGSNAVETGYADAVTNISCSPALTEAVDKFESREWLYGSPLAIEFKYETSKCPLMISMLRYQLALVDIRTGQKFVLYNSGYDLSSPSDSSFSEKGSRREVSIDPADMKKMTENSMKYKAFMFYMNRDMTTTKAMNWL